jgi:cyclopropane fatty-acyl-phospholipid synthase-like methyltransferase
MISSVQWWCKHSDIDSAIEHNRLDAQAAAIVEMIGGVPFQATFQGLHNVNKVADIGCGTGIATLQLASLFPDASVLGLDISPVPETTKTITPANVTWSMGNVLDPEFVKMRSNTGDEGLHEVDYVFGRMLFLGINDWPTYFSTVLQFMKPGAIIEHQDLDWKFYRAGTSECLSDGWLWHQKVASGHVTSGLSSYAGSGAEQHMRDAGFEILSVQQFEFSFVPSIKTPNSQAMGRYVQAKLMPNYPEILRKLLNSQGVSEVELANLTKDALRDLSSEEGVHQKYTVTIARKPFK